MLILRFILALAFDFEEDKVGKRTFKFTSHADFAFYISLAFNSEEEKSAEDPKFISHADSAFCIGSGI